MSEIKEILSNIALNPIKGDNLTGTDVRYDDEYEFVEDELSKQGSMIDRGQINWNKVIDVSVNILSNKSKDLKVCCYLTRALFDTKGLPGLQLGLNMNYQFLTTFWDDLFPIKKIARANSYEWLTSRLIPLLENIEPELDSLNDLEISYKCIQNIEKFLNEKLMEDAPALGNLRRLLYDLIEPLKRLKKLEAEQQSNLDLMKDNDEVSTLSEENINSSPQLTYKNVDPIDDSNSNDLGKINNKIISQSEQSVLQKSVTKVNSVVSNVTSEKDKNKIIRQCHEMLRNISFWSLENSLDTPSAYAMTRFSTWMSVEQIPIHTNNVTPLKPVPIDKVNHYNNLFASKKYLELIPLVEQSFSRSPFWLDAHRLVSSSLDALGMSDASIQVKEHLGLFLRRFPSVIDLKFSDDSGFADQLTKQWINSEVIPESSSESAFTSMKDGDSDYDEVVSQACDLVKQKKLNEAINLFKNKVSIQESFRKKTFWKYHLARFCYDNGEHKLSFFLLKEIDGILLKNNLKCWEPDLEKNVVFLLIQSLKNTNVINFLKTETSTFSDDSQNLDEKSTTYDYREYNQLYSRLCQLDPILALEV
ncbi:MAG: type VI secretion system protein TssA [Gammaproteobacteria bacterium]|nr:type VI secretion system protein TssA [Gammaproteobacteria bacterium]